MKTTLNIKNFRVFDENGVAFELNPITILTGSNSSGKSTVVKAIFLLNSFLSQIKNAVVNGDKIELGKYKIDFTQYPLNLLGRFDKVIHDGAKSKEVTIEYTMYSLMLSKEVNVQFVFVTDEYDELNNAFLNSLSISTDECVFFSSSKEETFCNLNIIKDDYTSFLIGEYATHAYIGIYGAYTLAGVIEEEQYKLEIAQVMEYLNSIENARREDIYRYVRTNNRDQPLVKDRSEIDILRYVQSSGTLFEIPLLVHLQDYKKSEASEYIMHDLLAHADQRLRSISGKVIDAFKQSEFKSLNEFFINFEQNYLSHAMCLGNILHLPHKGVHMLYARELELRSNGFIFSSDRYLLEQFNSDMNYSKIADETMPREKHKEISEWENHELTFDILYEVVMEWNRRFENFDDDCNNNKLFMQEDRVKPYEYIEPSMLNSNGLALHKAYKLLTQFAEAVVQEVVTPEWTDNMTYVSSTRADVSRLYTLDINNEFSKLLKKYFEQKRLYLNYAKNSSLIGKRDYEADSFMNRWIKKFEIGDSLTMHVDDEGLGVQIRLHMRKGDSGRLLADEGYGITQLVSILLQIETAILAARGKQIHRYLGMEKLDGNKFAKFQYEINTIAIEEPEIHLHPKYQSLLADMFCEAYEKFNIHFVVETHSEYLIRKLQLIASGHGDKKENGEKIEINRSDVSIFYVNSTSDKSKHKVKHIAICSDGYLDDTFGNGFYDEATRLSRLLMS